MLNICEKALLWLVIFVFSEEVRELDILRFQGDVDKILSWVAQNELKLCYYPSCGTRDIWALSQLDADFFVLSDYYPCRFSHDKGRFVSRIKQNCCSAKRQFSMVYPRVQTGDHVCFTIEGKVFMLFFEDNNITLQRLKSNECPITFFVGIQDGCQEGGNYECVNEDPFLSKVLEISTKPLFYFTNHSQFLEDRSVYSEGQIRKFRRLRGHPSGRVFTLLYTLDNPRPNRQGIIPREGILTYYPENWQCSPVKTTIFLDSIKLDENLLLKMVQFYKRYQTIALYRVT